MRKGLFVFVFWVLVFSTSVCAQGIFDCSHSLSFARYLKSDGSYTLASKVLLEMGDSCLNDSVVMEILQLDIQGRKFASAYQHGNRLLLFTSSEINKRNVSELIIRTALAAKLKPTAMEWERAQRILSADSFFFLKQCASLFDFSNKSPLVKDTISLTSLNVWYQQRQSIRFKNPAKAALLSAVVPGLGKAYVGLKKDALVSFVSVGLSVFQAVRGFNARGTKSVYGWVSAAFAVSFYSGTIYGSAASAKKYNQRKIDAYHEQFIQKVFHY